MDNFAVEQNRIQQNRSEYRFILAEFNRTEPVSPGWNIMEQIWLEENRTNRLEVKIESRILQFILQSSRS